MTNEHDSLGFEKLVGAITASVVNSSSGVLKDDTKHEKKKQMSNWKGIYHYNNVDQYEY